MVDWLLAFYLLIILPCTQMWKSFYQKDKPVQARSAGQLLRRRTALGDNAVPAAERHDGGPPRRSRREEILQVMNAARMLQMVASVALVPELPLLAAGLAPSLAAWRGMPLAGGLR